MNSKDAVKMYPELDYFMNEERSDFVFIIDGQRVPILKQLLSLKSPVFRAMYSGTWKESNVNEIAIEDTTFETFKSMIQFLYTGHVVLDDDHKIDFIRNMIILADKYQLVRLVEEMCVHINKVISLDNFDDFCNMAYDLDAKQVIPILKSFMKNNFATFTQMDIKRLKTINELTGQSWLEVVMAEKFRTSIPESTVISDFSKYPEFDYFMNEDESDVVFLVGEQRVPAIKQVLALKSRIFRDMFEKNVDVKEITLEETTESLKALIYFLYTDNILDDKFSINFPDLYELACKYKVYRFIESMAQLIVITSQNFELITQIVTSNWEYKSVLLHKKLKEFMNSNFKQYFYGRCVDDLKKINEWEWTDQSLLENIFSCLKKAKQLFRTQSFTECTRCQKISTYRFNSVLETDERTMNEQTEITYENFDEKCKLADETKSESLISKLKLFIDKNFKDFYDKDIDYLKQINESTAQSLLEISLQRLRKAQNYYETTYYNHDTHTRRFKHCTDSEVEYFI